jgi:hypothetical protein
VPCWPAAWCVAAEPPVRVAEGNHWAQAPPRVPRVPPLSTAEQLTCVHRLRRVVHNLLCCG